ncbi:hypothetical protein DMI65_20010 [Escherichia coli]|nr:hypothetical protein [Escherichia coli]
MRSCWFSFPPFNSLPFPEGALREPNGLLGTGAILALRAFLMAYQRGISRGFSATPSSGGRPICRGVMARITAYQP